MRAHVHECLLHFRGEARPLCLHLARSEEIGIGTDVVGDTVLAAYAHEHEKQHGDDARAVLAGVAVDEDAGILRSLGNRAEDRAQRLRILEHREIEVLGVERAILALLLEHRDFGRIC